VEPFEFTSNGGGGVALLRRVKRRRATFYEVINFDFMHKNLCNNLKYPVIGLNKEKRPKATQPFGFAQGHESFDFALDREPVERPVEWQMTS
jgi:hypothetical protein